MDRLLPVPANKNLNLYFYKSMCIWKIVETPNLGVSTDLIIQKIISAQTE